jgi:L-asparaginase
LLAEAAVGGIVAAGLAPGAAHPDFMDAMESAQKAGIPVVLAAHVGNGRVILTRGNKERGFIVADNLTPKKARILLMLALCVTRDRDEIQRMFDTY